MNKIWCRLFGHKWAVYGKPIIHVAQRLIETDKDCLRCGLKGTEVLPWISSEQ